MGSRSNEVIGCEQVRRGVRRGAAEASGSGGVQRAYGTGRTFLPGLKRETTPIGSTHLYL